MAVATVSPQPGVAGLRVGMVYRDTVGRESRRIVHLKRLIRTHSGYYFTAFCELRQEPRMFAVDQVKALIDYRTGDVHEQPDAFFAQLKGRAEWQENLYREEPTETDQVITGCADGLTVLLYFADADGRMHPKELRIVKDYIAWRVKIAGLSAKYSKPIVERYIEGAVPDREDFTAALRRLIEDDPTHAAKVADYARLLVQADRVVDREEKLRMDALMAIMTTPRDA